MIFKYNQKGMGLKYVCYNFHEDMQPFLPVQARAVEICIIFRIMKGSWEAALSILLIKARSNCWGPCPAKFWYPHRWESPNSLDHLFQHLTTLSVRNVFLQVVGVSPAAISAGCISFHWAFLEDTRSLSPLDPCQTGRGNN